MRSRALAPLAALGLLTTFVIASVNVACSSSSEAPAAPSDDAGSDGALTPSPPSPGDDAGEGDATRPEITPAARLPVVCEQDPCYVAVSGNGGEHVCGLLRDGTVRCWGRDTRTRVEPADGGAPEVDGALGRGRLLTNDEGATPAPVVGLAGVTQVSVGPNLGTCARTEDGSVYCWGRNEFGQLGRPRTEPRLAAATRVEGLPPVSTVALGGRIGCAIASDDGALYCWGGRDTLFGAAAKIGDATTFPPQRIDAFRPPLKELAIATIPRNSTTPFHDTVVALLEGRVLASLGEIPAGETSVSTPVTTSPVEVPRVARIGAFAFLQSDGLLASWLPSDGYLYVPLPHTAVDLTIAAGRAAVTGALNRPYVEQGGVLLASGRLFRWGRNVGGALGYAPNELDFAPNPLDMTHVAGDRVVSFATTLGTTCVSSVDGKVKCWGTNLCGELGRGTTDAEPHPEAEVIR